MMTPEAQGRSTLHDAIRHVHESTPHPALWPCTFEQIFRIEAQIRACHRYTWGLYIGQQRRPLTVTIPPVMRHMTSQIVILFDPFSRLHLQAARIRYVLAARPFCYVEADSIRSPRRTRGASLRWT